MSSGIRAELWEASGTMKSKERPSVLKQTVKRGMRPILPGILVLCAILVISVIRANARGQVEAYVYDPCGGCFADGIPCKPCTVVTELEQYLGAELNRLGLSEQYRVSVGNTLLPEQKEKYLFRIGAFDKGEYPVVFVNDRILYGWDEIRTDFSRALGGEAADPAPEESAQEPFQRGRNLFVYFQLQSCAECEEAELYFETLEQEGLPAERLTFDFDSDFELFRRYCEAYGADSEALCLPAVFVGDSVLEGMDEIETFLEEYLNRGDGSKTRYVPSQTE